MAVWSLVSSGVLWYIGWLVGTMKPHELFAQEKTAAALKWSSLLSIVSYLTGIGYEKLIFPYLGLFAMGILVVPHWFERKACERPVESTSPPGE